MKVLIKMFRKTLITALVIINSYYGSALVTMSPRLAKIIPTNLPPLHQQYIQCFNKYWEIKESLESGLRQRWNCTLGCEKEIECCISYKVWESLSTLKLTEDCQSGALDMIQLFLPMALNKIKGMCEPDYPYNSEICKQLDYKLADIPIETYIKGNYNSTTV